MEYNIMEEEKFKTCPYCCEKVSIEAIICKSCNSFIEGRKKRHEYNWFKRNSYWLNWVSIILSFVFLYLGIIQFNNSKEEKSKAQTALTNSHQANENANNANETAKSAIKETKELLSKIKTIKDSIAVDKIQLKGYQSLLFSKEETINTGMIRTMNGVPFNFTNYLEFAGAKHKKGMNDINWILIRAKDKGIPAISEIKKFYFDLLELSFINFLSNKYRFNWIRKHAPDFQLLITETDATSWPKAEKGKYTIWTKQKIEQEFLGNTFLPYNEKLISNIYLPQDVSINTNRIDKQNIKDDVYENHERSIVFENPRFRYEIIISNGPSYPLDSLYLKILKLTYLDPKNNWYIQNIQFTFKSIFKTKSEYSENIVEEYKWIEEMKYLFKQEYDWDLILNEIKR